MNEHESAASGGRQTDPDVAGEAVRADEPTRILIVDDRAENVLALESILAGPAVEILIARSGAEALGSLLRQDVAVVLLDVLMPGMDGFETARLIRAREACRHIPLIFLTAVGSELKLIERGCAVGAVDYLVKPLNPEMVKAKVAVFVDLYRKTRQLRQQREALRLLERARSEEVLRENEALYEASFNSAAVGIAHAAADGRWLRVNPHFCKITGYSAAEATDLRFRDVVHPADLAAGLVGLNRLAGGEIEIFRREERYIRKDGRVIWVDSTVSPLRDRSGTLRSFVAVIEDITARHDAERRERLLADVSQTLLSSLDNRRDLDVVVRSIVASLGDWCVIGVRPPLNEEGVAPVLAVACADREREAQGSRLRSALAASPAYERWLTETQALTSAEPEVDLARLWGVAPQLLAELGVRSALSLPLTVRRQAFGHATFLSDGSFGAGDVTTAYEVTRRLTLALDNGDLYRQTQEAVRARDDFLEIASHELRTPLTPLRIHLQRLVSGMEVVPAADPGRVQATLHRCERKVRRLEALVDHLFDASRLERERPRLMLDTFDLGVLTRRIVETFTDEMKAAGCPVVLDVRGPATGSWDRLRLEQVISNVLENAIKFGPGRPIEISVEPVEDRVRLTVRDHGSGIPQGQLDQIFERFRRIVSSPHHSGLRLGLYVTRQMVEAHQGSIRADNDPGGGARFTIELPLKIEGALGRGGGKNLGRGEELDRVRDRGAAQGRAGALRACG